MRHRIYLLPVGMRVVRHLFLFRSPRHARLGRRGERNRNSCLKTRLLTGSRETRCRIKISYSSLLEHLCIVNIIKNDDNDDDDDDVYDDSDDDDDDNDGDDDDDDDDDDNYDDADH
ncbi:hypothetical protein ElyMa_000212800 [Elysia marginata]|uniref:Uncharacterized protein n=1 Tax=Elysia marginata TaxID=1093978 RepID=A0AAV4EYP8_9GAST|nr:hypothetical protein ElyMa_000212800 [Elysia marginata]